MGNRASGVARGQNRSHVVAPADAHRDAILPALRANAQMFPPQRIATTANSNHPGVVNVLLFDGSIRSVPYTISLPVWRALGTRAGGEVLQGNEF